MKNQKTLWVIPRDTRIQRAMFVCNAADVRSVANDLARLDFSASQIEDGPRVDEGDLYGELVEHMAAIGMAEVENKRLAALLTENIQTIDEQAKKIQDMTDGLRAALDDKAALENEVAQLRAQIATLQAAIGEAP